MPPEEPDFDLSNWSFYWQSGDYVLYCPRLPDGVDAIDRSMIYDVREHSVISIESNGFSYALRKRMYAEGVPIVSVRPPGENIMEKAIRELTHLGLGTQEFIDAYNEIRAMKISGRSVAEMERRIQALAQKV